MGASGACLALAAMENEMSLIVLDGVALLVTANWELLEQNWQSFTVNEPLVEHEFQPHLKPVKPYYICAV